MGIPFLNGIIEIFRVKFKFEKCAWDLREQLRRQSVVLGNTKEVSLVYAARKLRRKTVSVSPRNFNDCIMFAFTGFLSWINIIVEIIFLFSFYSLWRT